MLAAPAAMSSAPAYLCGAACCQSVTLCVCYCSVVVTAALCCVWCYMQVLNHVTVTVCGGLGSCSLPSPTTHVCTAATTTTSPLPSGINITRPMTPYLGYGTPYPEHLGTGQIPLGYGTTTGHPWGRVGKVRTPLPGGWPHHTQRVPMPV